jgi:hypothetical protein
MNIIYQKEPQAWNQEWTAQKEDELEAHDSHLQIAKSAIKCNSNEINN